MTRLSCICAATFVIAAAMTAAIAAKPKTALQQRRDGTPEAPRAPGTAVVSGLVSLGDDAKTPVRRAVVTLTVADGTEALAAISDEDGRFTIEHVPAGHYALAASRPAYLTIPYGAHRPGGRGTLLVIRDGQHLIDLMLSLPHGAVLAGRITLANGQPAEGVQMVAVPAWLANASGIPPLAREFRTNDLGEFRLFGLPPDTYFVAALPSFGRGEVQRVSDGDISEALRQLQSGGASAGLATVATVTYAPIYYPGTSSVADATRITIAEGQTREDLSFAIAPFPSAAIRGRVVGIDGIPTRLARIQLEAVGPPLPAGATGISNVPAPNQNGEFQITGVSPGGYRIHVRAGGVTVNPNGTTSAHGDAQTQYAMADVSIAGQDVDGVVLTLRQGNRFSGTIVADSSVSFPPALKGAFVVVEPITLGPRDTLAGVLLPGVPSRNAILDDAGHFTVTGIEPFDYYDLQIKLPPAAASAGWHVDSVRYGNRDLRDAPLTFDDGSIEGVEIHLTKAITGLTGLFTADSGTPATDYFIVAFPADRALWHAASPRIRVMRPAADGSFSTRDLPPGEYRLAALTDLDERQARQREFLESIYGNSIGVAITAGETTHQEIHLRR